MEVSSEVLDAIVTPQPDTKWYVLRVVSGKERKVKEYLDKDIQRSGWTSSEEVESEDLEGLRTNLPASEERVKSDFGLATQRSFGGGIFLQAKSRTKLHMLHNGLGHCTAQSLRVVSRERTVKSSEVGVCVRVVAPSGKTLKEHW